MITWKKLLISLPLALSAPVALAETFNIVVVDDSFAMNETPFDSPELEKATLSWLRILDRVVYSPEPLYLALSDVAFTDGTRGRANARNTPPFEYPSEFGLDSTVYLPVPLPIVLGADTPNNIGDMLDTQIAVQSASDDSVVVAVLRLLSRKRANCEKIEGYHGRYV